MSFSDLTKKLSALSAEERREFVRRTFKLGDIKLSKEDEARVNARLAAEQADPEATLSVDEVKARLRARFPRWIQMKGTGGTEEKPQG